MHRAYAYIEYNKAKLHYSKSGKGKKILLASHGFGQTGDDFSPIEEVLYEEYTIYSFDLFYHGQSFWHTDTEPLSKGFWKELLNQFLAEEQIQKFSLLGFSMGGKFVLASLEAFPHYIEKLFLIAPDGIRPSAWYNFATSYKITRSVFRKLIVEPEFFSNLVKAIDRLKLADRRVLRFAQSQMKSKEQRRKVYYSWTVFRKLVFNMSNIARLIRSNDIDLNIFLGEYDKIITQRHVSKLVKHLDQYSLKVLKAGHSNLIAAVAKELAGK